MREPVSPLFEFSSYGARSRSYRHRLKAFAAGRPFRSADVSELILEDDFYRRPLRPEDLEFLTFTKPVRVATANRLSSLASQRMLSSLYELCAAAPPPQRDLHRFEAFAEFASERNRQHAARLTPFLEAYAFGYLDTAWPGSDPAASFQSRLEELHAQERRYWSELFEALKSNNYLQDGLKFVLIQRWCLAPSQRKVLAEATARGHFEDWPWGSPPDLRAWIFADDTLRKLASRLGVTRVQHSYWQFYLPTSLAKCNLLYALARRTERAFALYGALYAAQASQLAFEAALTEYAPHIAEDLCEARGDTERQVSQLLLNGDAGWQFVLRHRGAAAAAEMEQGLAAAALLAETNRRDLGEQLRWLSAIERYREYARLIGQRIEVECPDIDRDTFVEPRDMCSTTHVHNDHRLVTVERGTMHFWGNLGMRLELREGDTVLIPEGRLHGSTVLSPECTYHQPIIPDDWVRELRGEVPSEVSRAA